MAQLEQTERKLRGNPAFQKEYQGAIQMYEAEGLSEECQFREITLKDDHPIYNVPHHVVIRLNKKQLSIG